MERTFRMALSGAALVVLCLTGAACGGEDDSLTVVSHDTEVALMPAIPGLMPMAQATKAGSGPPQAMMIQREAAQDISPDPIPARESAGTSVVNSGTNAGSETAGDSTASDTQGSIKR